MEELRLAFQQKGDEERDQAKAKFLREARRGREDPAAAKEEEKVSSQVDQSLRAPEDKMRIVAKIGQEKRR